MTRRIAYLWSPRFATELAFNRAEWGDGGARPTATPSRPAALTRPGPGGPALAAVNAPAEEAGLKPGLSLADARALVPALRAAARDGRAEDRAAAALAEGLDRFSPIVAIDRDRQGGGLGLFLDLTGCAHLFGGEAAALAAIRQWAGARGHVACIALAPTPGAAWALARYGDGDEIRASEGDARPDALPVAALRLSAATLAVLDRLGLRRIGDLRAAPRHELADRFGDVIARRLDQLTGALAEPVAPRRPAPPFLARRLFAEPIAAASDLAATLGALAETLCADLAAAGKGARKIELAFHRADGRVERIAAGVSRARRDPAALTRLLGGKLDQVDPGFGVDAAVLAALTVEDLGAEQIALHADAERRPPEMAALVDRLGARLGARHVVKLAARDSHAPDRAQVQLSLFDHAAAAARAPVADRAAPPRPVRLHRPARRAGVHVSPGHPPMTLAIDGVARSLRHVEGPQRTGGEWWRETPDPDRDFWRVEDETGARWLLVRDHAQDDWGVQGALG